MLDAVFWAIHSGLAREGPGDEASLRRALSMMKGLPAAPDILDVGCGPGAQSLALASLTAGTITAVDAHAPFLADLNRAAESRGLDSRYVAKNGNIVWGRVVLRLLRDAKGQPLHFLVSIVDLTERKHAEFELRKLSRAVEQSPASIVITDLQGAIEYVNPKFEKSSKYF